MDSAILGGSHNSHLSEEGGFQSSPVISVSDPMDEYSVVSVLSVTSRLSSAAKSEPEIPLKHFIAAMDGKDSAGSSAAVSSTELPARDLARAPSSSSFVPNRDKYDQTMQTQRRLERTPQHEYDEIRARAESVLYWAESASTASQKNLQGSQASSERLSASSVRSSAYRPHYLDYPPSPRHQPRSLDPPSSYMDVAMMTDSYRSIYSIDQKKIGGVYAGSSYSSHRSRSSPSESIISGTTINSASSQGKLMKGSGYHDRSTKLMSNRQSFGSTLLERLSSVATNNKKGSDQCKRNGSVSRIISNSETASFGAESWPGDIEKGLQIVVSSASQDSDRSRPPPPGMDKPRSSLWANLPEEKLSTFAICQRELRMWYRQKIVPFWKILIAQLLCVIYVLVFTFSPAGGVVGGLVDPETRNIIDPNSAENTNNGVIFINGHLRAVVAVGGWQKCFLAISRMSAFSMYPMLVVVFVTKMKALQTFLAKTTLSMCLGVIKEGHDYHAKAGRYIAFDVWLHTLFHLLRWASQGNISLLWTTAVGLSGLVTVVGTPLITFPMMFYKEKLRYEIRKGLHYLFYLFAVAMCFHVPPTGVPNGGFIAPILGTCIVLYALDKIYVCIYMTENIETTAFHVLSSGVRISMPTSERFRERAGRAWYAYICLPWIDDKQWHAFSLFEDPSDPSIQQMFILKNGDWTAKVHAALARDTTRPCWLRGPFPSPYSHASMYDNQILVASGIGITPALATISAYKSSRHINLVWAVRDPEMLGFFLEHLYLDHGGWNLIFYTGKEPIPKEIEEQNEVVTVIRGRPKLSSLIPNIVYANESGDSAFSLYEEDEVQTMYVKRLGDHVMSSWGMMYCGGSKPVISTLEDVSIDCNIDLHIDSFAW